MTRRLAKVKHSSPTFHLRKKTTSRFHRYPSPTSRETYFGNAQSNESPYRDSTSSNNEFSNYAQSIKLISTRATTHPVTNETVDLYSDEATLSKFIYERRPTITKPTFVALPSLTSHSTFYEYSRGIPCQPQDSPHSLLTKLGVIISYSIHLERRITSPSTYIIRWNITTESTPKKLIYSTSSNSTTFQVGIPSSIFRIKLT